MAVDLVARAAATTATAAADGTLATLRQFADLPQRTIPAGCDKLIAGAGAAAAIYVADAQANAALASAHPRFCKADAAGRYFRFASPEVDIAHGGATGTGNDQPAIKATIAYAIAAKIQRVVNKGGLLNIAMWSPVRTTPMQIPAADGYPIFLAGLTGGLELDFGGATIRLKGVTGGDRMVGQSIEGGIWLGGWLSMPTGSKFDFLIIRNVIVDGGYAGDTLTNAASNITDKALHIHDSTIRLVELENVELRNFAGEIVYDNASALHRSWNCHFHGSPQSAWNPSGLGRVEAYGLRAGRAYQCAEVLGGAGHYYDASCVFYAAGYGGSTFFGGPTPAFTPNYPYNWVARESALPPPIIYFDGTRFEGPGNVNLGQFCNGRIVTVDMTASIGNGAPATQDIQMEIDAWCDRSTGGPAMMLLGPNDLTSQVPGAPTGTFYERTRAIAVRLNCRRTREAQVNNRTFSPAVLLQGLFDKDTCRIEIEGDGARSAWAINGTAPAQFAVPLMVSNTRYPGTLLPGGGLSDSPTGADLTLEYRPDCTGYFIVPQTPSSTWSVALDLTYSYAHGQRMRFDYYGSDPSRVVTFAKNAAGLMLPTDRTLRRTGEYLELTYDAVTSKFTEVAYVGQGA